MRARAFLLLFFVSLFVSTAHAWESFPEFGSLTEDEQSRFDQPTLLGPEYSSDILAFSKPYDWQYHWLSHDIAFDGSVGSISPVHFLIDNRLKARSSLASWLDFRFTYFDERNHDRQASHHLIELVFWPFSKFGISLYAEPSYFKREDDEGIALIYRPQPRHEIRLFNTFVDLTRKKRNDRTDTFKDSPNSVGLVGRLWSPHEDAAGVGDYVEYGFRYDDKTLWSFPDDGYEYTYWRLIAMASVSKRVLPRMRLNLRLQGDRKFEARTGLQGLQSRQSLDRWTTDRVLTTFQFVFSELGPSQTWELTSGLHYTMRRWRNQNDTLAFHDYLPHLWLKMPAFDSTEVKGFLRWGWDLTWHRKFQGALLHPTDEDKKVNQRFNASFGFTFNNNKAELLLLGSFDLEDLGTGDTWEGGNAQLRWFF
ncbi:MAG: hypothetical protein AB1540_08555 [Bdellovibrionota bacterium]